MSAITLNPERIANVTSSEIFKLFGTPAVRKTYLEECQIEKRVGLALETDSYSRPIAWGELMERRVNDLLGIAYKSTGQTSLHHPNKNLRWGGSPDITNEREKIVCEVKGYQRKKFALLTDAIMKANADKSHLEFKISHAKEYWQAVSNTCILGYKKIEIISYMPYFSELQAISDIATNWPEESSQWRYKFVFDAFTQGKIEELTYLPDGGYYKNLNVFSFEMPEADAKLLKEKVIDATAIINTSL